MSKIVLENIHQHYPGPNGTENIVLSGISLVLEGPAIVTLMGPSGCGKSTLLRMMGGVRAPAVKSPTTGRVLIDGKECNDQHDSAVTVFQNYSNRPDLTVRQNVEFPFTLGLWKKKYDTSSRVRRVEEMLAAVGLADKADLYPWQLSGGQNQRVALARALALRPGILLLDEPFGALDARIRKEMQALLVKLVNDNPCLVVMVTHDIAEATRVSDRILMMRAKPGQITHDIDQTIRPAPNAIGPRVLREPNKELELLLEGALS